MVAVPVSGDVSLLVDKPIATVLVVDDLADNLSLMSSLLKDHYRVKVANQGEKGLRIAAQLPAPDLILLDIMMPGMDGYEVCRRLKADPATRDIPVIFLTARADVADEALGLALGAVDYITKPISPPILLARVQTHLALKATADFLRSKSDYLQQEVALRTLEVQAIQDVTIMVMAALAETRDSETGNHIRRTQLYVRPWRSACVSTRASSPCSASATSSCCTNRRPCTTSARWAFRTPSCSSLASSRWKNSRS